MGGGISLESDPVPESHWTKLSEHASKVYESYPDAKALLEQKIQTLKHWGSDSVRTVGELRKKMAVEFSESEMVKIGIPAQPDHQAANVSDYLLATLTVDDADEHVSGGAWDTLSKATPIKCVALAMLIVGAIFLIAFMVFKVSSTPTTQSAGTLVGCGFMTAAVATAGIAFLFAE